MLQSLSSARKFVSSSLNALFLSFFLSFFSILFFFSSPTPRPPTPNQQVWVVGLTGSKRLGAQLISAHGRVGPPPMGQQASIMPHLNTESLSIKGINPSGRQDGVVVNESGEGCRFTKKKKVKEEGKTEREERKGKLVLLLTNAHPLFFFLFVFFFFLHFPLCDGCRSSDGLLAGRWRCGDC